MAVASTCPCTTLPWCHRRSWVHARRSGTMVCRAAVQETYRGGPAGTYAREMERLSAKESLLLAFKDAGGFQSLVSGKTTEMQKIDVNERIVGLERLNPTPRPTTIHQELQQLHTGPTQEENIKSATELLLHLHARSPFLEGRWNFEWIGDTSPESFIMRFIFERAPSTIANLIGIDLMIREGYSKIKADLKFLNSIESKVTLTTKLTVEGPMRMREEYSEALLETPSLSSESLPDQLKPALGQAAGALQQLPAQIRDPFSNGLRLPLNGSLQRLFMISYLDEEILIVRDAVGAPDVLTRIESTPASPPSSEPIIPEYES